MRDHPSGALTATDDRDPQLLARSALRIQIAVGACTRASRVRIPRKKTPRGTTTSIPETTNHDGREVACKEGQETRYCGKHEEGAANRRMAELVQLAMIASMATMRRTAASRKTQTHTNPATSASSSSRAKPPCRRRCLNSCSSNDQDAAVLVDERSHVLIAKHVTAALDAFLTERPPPRAA